MNRTNKTSADHTPVNLSYMLEQIGDRNTVFSIIQRYSMHLQNQMKELEDAVALGNRETTHRIAHSIRGGAANIGADNLHVWALRLEKKSVIRENPDLSNELKHVKCEYSKVREYFEEKFGDGRHGC